MVDYKLRLGDGTTFQVDEKGLTTWLQGGLVDDKARIQPAGSKKWFTLKQVLAAQGTQRGHAVRQTEEGRADVSRQAAAETAEIERKVAEQRAAEERKAGEDLAAAERKAAADRNAAERKLIEDREEAQRKAAAERAAAEARAAAEIQAEKERHEAEKREAAERAAAERQAAEERAEAERREAAAREAAREAERVAEAERLVAAERVERAEKKRKADEARIEAEQRAAEAARLAAERKAAEEQAAERKKAEEAAAAARREAEAKVAAAREAERVAEAEKRVAAERAERAEKKRRAEEAALADQRAADERRAAEQRAADERLAAERRAADERLAARAAEERASREREAARQAVDTSASAGVPETEIAIEPAATMVKVEDFERELGLVPVMFNDGTEPATGRADRGAYSPGRDRSESAASLREDAATGVVKPPTAVDTVVMRLLKVLDRGVVWVVRTLAPLVGDTIARSARSLKSAGPKLQALLARRASAPEPASAPDAGRPVPAPVAERPVFVPTPARVADKPVTTPAPAPWAAPPPPPSPAAMKSTAPVKSTGAAPQRQPSMPPPSFQKMEVIPFAAAAAEPQGDNDVWEGDDPWQEPGAVSTMFSVAWLWVKRATIATALIVVVVALALNKQKWLPQAKDAATVLGQNVDKLQESTRTVPPEAIDAARAQIPYLRPQTIELILAKSAGVLEPAEVFRRAHQAAETARPSLPTHVAAEIDNLTTAAAAGLDSTEGEQLRGYLAALRAGTPTAAYQDKEAVWLMARGVKRLSAEQLARMEELFAQAVTVALTPPAQP